MTDITLNLNARIQPEHRHELEDAFESALEELVLAAELTGGGSVEDDNGEITSCDIELYIDNNLDDEEFDETISKVTEIMESMLAPVGSKLIIYSDDNNVEPTITPFGIQQGLGLYLNSEDLDDDVYDNCDINHVYEEIERLLGDFQTGHIASYWEGEETALYLYGASFEDMHKLIKPLLDEYPLCQKCRVVQIA